MTTYSLTFHETPKSLNRTAKSQWPYIRQKKLWEGNFQVRLLTEKVPRHLSRVVASAALTFPSIRRRDEGNFRFMLEKALGDTLVGGGWLEDDTPEHFRFERVVFEPERGKALTIVTLETTP